MPPIQLDSKEGLATGWAGFGGAQNLPERARAKAQAATQDVTDDERTPRRGLLGAAVRFVRNAAVGLLLLSAVPFGTVAWQSAHLTTRPWTDTQKRLEQVETWRVLKAPVDASITPLEAGLSFSALQAKQTGEPIKAGAPNLRGNEQFPARATVEQPMWPWRAHKPGAELFQTRLGGFDGPSADDVIAKAEKGFSPAEMAWLKELAEAPVWKNFDKVGGAKSVDLIGGQFQLPFRQDAFAPVMPIVRFASTKELAYAGVARAAYYLANNEPVRAEAALRSVVSFGFAMMDNGTSVIDGIIGRIIVGIGHKGMSQFATAERPFPAGFDNITPPSKVRTTNFGDKRGSTISAQDLRQQLLKDISDPAVPRTIRYEQLNELALTSCQNIPEMMFGPNQEMRDAFTSVAPALVRFPSEQAHLDLILDQTNRFPESEIPHGLAQHLVVGAATVAATITNNPRLATCTKLAVFRW